MKKILVIVLVLIIVLFVLIGFAGFFYIGPIIKAGIQQFGPQVTKTSINVDAVDVSLLSGSASIKGLVVGNPQGYTNGQAINVGSMAVSLAPLSVTSSKILIHSVRVDAPVITFEASFGGSNLSKILSNINAFVPKNNGPVPKIEIDDFMITGAKVNVSISGVVSKVVPLPDIHLTDLGKSSDGLTPVELARAILGTIVTGTVQAVTGSAGGIGNVVSNITSSLGSFFGKK